MAYDIGSIQAGGRDIGPIEAAAASGLVAVVNDTEGITETVLAVSVTVRLANDTEGVTETTPSVSAAVRIADDTEGVAETIATAAAQVRLTDETVNVGYLDDPGGDNPFAVSVSVRVVDDTEGITETALTDTPIPLSIVNETETITESVLAVSVAVRASNDTVGIEEQAGPGSTPDEEAAGEKLQQALPDTDLEVVGVGAEAWATVGAATVSDALKDISASPDVSYVRTFGWEQPIATNRPFFTVSMAGVPNAYSSRIWSNSQLGEPALGHFLRPHIRATKFKIQFQWRVVGDYDFDSGPRVDVVDHASQIGTNEPYHVVKFSKDLIALPDRNTDWKRTEVVIPASLIRGHDQVPGISNFNDLGLRFYAPSVTKQTGLADPVLEITDLFLELESVVPYTNRDADFGIRYLTGAEGGWVVVNYKGWNNGIEGDPNHLEGGPAQPGYPNPGVYPRTCWNDGGATQVLSTDNVLADAVRRCGYSVKEGQPCVIEIESSVTGFDRGVGGTFNYTNNRFNGGVSFGDSTDSEKNAFFPKVGAWGSNNQIMPQAASTIPSGNQSGTRPMKKLLIRAEETSGAARPIFSKPFVSMWLNSSPTTMEDLALEGFLFWRNAGTAYGFQTSFDQYSESVEVGLYDCNLTGPHGGQQELLMAMRVGYINSLDICDCQTGTLQEHFFYGGLTKDDSQFLRNRNTISANFFPPHPAQSPLGLPYLFRTFVQLINRHNQCGNTATGGGPWWGNGATAVIEDNTADRVSGNPTCITMVSPGMDIVVRRLHTPDLDGGAGIFMAWIVGANNASNKNGWHGFSLDIGQFDGPLQGEDNPGNNNFCGPSVSPEVGTPPMLQSAPAAYPNPSGNVWGTGHVLLEDLTGNIRAGTTHQTTPFRFGACRSVTIRRGKFSNFSRKPMFHDFPMDSSQNWQAAGAGPLPSMAFRFDLVGTQYAGNPNEYYMVGAGLMAFGSSSNPLALGTASSPHFLKGTQIQLLAQNPPGIKWPPWMQRNDLGIVTSGLFAGITVGRVFPLLKRASSQGTGVTNYSPALNTSERFATGYRYPTDINVFTGPSTAFVRVVDETVGVTETELALISRNAKPSGMRVSYTYPTDVLVTVDVAPKPTGMRVSYTYPTDITVVAPTEAEATGTRVSYRYGDPEVTIPAQALFGGNPAELTLDSPSFLVTYAPEPETGESTPGEGGLS